MFKEWVELSELSVAAGRIQTSLSDGICECHPLGAWMEVEEPMSYAVAFHIKSLKPFLTSCAAHCKPTGASEVFSWKASVICSVLLQDFWSAAGILADPTDMSYPGESRFMGFPGTMHPERAHTHSL